MLVGFLGFGEAARAFQETLIVRDPNLRFMAWDIKLQDPATAPHMKAAMEERGVAVGGPAGFSEADWIISAVTADQSFLALRSIQDHIVQGQVVIDINSVSPGRKRESASLVEAREAAYLDMAVMAPVHPRGHRTPVLIAGSVADKVVPVLERLEFDFRNMGDEPGQATAIKMVRSVFVKGLEAITVEALLAARASGCFEEISTSLAKSFSGLGWPEFAAYEFERTMQHGKRRAAEMRESAATVKALGLNGDLVDQIAETQDLMGGIDISDLNKDSVEELVDRALAARLKA
jgi:3-hydroxyisobutyrate dehydrogenase-like beta-hydroxyacid dehydrogenase